MPEVWTYDILSRHFMPRSDTVAQLFILLCRIARVIYSIGNTKLRIFLRTSKFIQKKTDRKVIIDIIHRPYLRQ